MESFELKRNNGIEYLKLWMERSVEDLSQTRSDQDCHQPWNRLSLIYLAKS